jgi:hypothetical protein
VDTLTESLSPKIRDNGRWVVRAVIVLAPVIGVVLLRAPLINQNGYLDAWFYTGYGWAPIHHLTVFENTYYGVRFPPILLIAATSRIFGALGGYLVLRYVIMLTTGVALYACVRQFTSRRVGVGSVVLLTLNVFYLRLVLWDYVTFVAIPASLAGVALWPRRRGRRGLVAAAGSGALLATAAFSNPLAISIIPPLLGVELLAALRRRDGEQLRFLVRVIAAVAGGLAVFAFGALIYWTLVGFSPYDLLRPTINFLRNQDAFAAGYVLPVHDWIFNEPWIYAPPILLAGMILVMGRRLLDTSVAASLGQFSLLFVVELFIYRFVTTSSVIETWWAYGLTAVSMAFAGALVLDEVDRLPGRRWWTVLAAVAAVGITGLLIRVWGAHAVSEYGKLRGHYWHELVVMVVALVGLLGWRRLRGPSGALAVAVLLIIVTALALTPAAYLGVGRTGEFSGIPDDELRGYAVSHRIVRDIAAQDTPASRTLVWYPAATGLLGAIWSILPNVGGSVNAYDRATPLSQLTEYEAARLAYPTTARILVLSQNPPELEQAQATLRRRGYVVRAQPPGAWVDGRLQHQMLQLRELPAGGLRRAVRMSATSILDAWTRRDATAACQLSVPSLVLSLTAQDGTCPRGVRQKLLATPPPGRQIGAIKIVRDTAWVTIAGTHSRMILKQVQSEWLVAAGAVPWVD